MTFLAPLSGIIAGAVAAPLLALLYFLRLRRRPIRVSSTMLWTRAVRDLQVNAPFQWIRPSWLLLLQMLALASFCLAAARPAIEAEGEQAARLIIMIDRSASMAAPAGDDDDPDATRLDLAKRRALELIARLEAGGVTGEGATQAAVVSFAAEARLVADFTSDAAALRGPVQSITQTDQPADLDAALRLAGAMLASADEERGIRVALLSDGAVEAAPRAIAALKNAEFRFVRTGPPPGARRNNAGVVALSAQRDFDEPAIVRLFTRLINTRDQPIETTLTITVEGTPLRAVSVEIPSASPEGPGEATKTIQWRSAASSGQALVVASISGEDDLAADDRAGFLLAPPPRPRVLVVAPAERSAADRLAHEMLLRALRATEPASVEEMSASRYATLTQTGRLPADHDLVVFDGVPPDILPPASSLSFGAGLPPLGARIVEAPDDEAPSTSRIVSWRRTAPLLRHVSLDAVVLRSAPAVVAGDGGPGIEALAQGERGPLIVRIAEGARDRVIVGFDLAQSNWPVQAGFAIFIANAVESLTAPGGAGGARYWTTSEPVVVAPARGAERVRASGPIERAVEVPRGAAEVSLGVLPLAGVYEAQGAAAGDRVIPVNLLDERESALTTADSVRLPAGDAPATSLAATQPKEIWQWFVLAGLVLLTIEWLLYAARMRV